MGQSLKKFANGEQRDIDVGPMINDCFQSYFKNTEKWSLDDFCHAVCQTIECINEKSGSTQFKVPEKERLKQLYENYEIRKGKSLTKDKYQKMLQEIILETGVTGYGAKDILLYLFGIPITALFIKQRIIPQAIPNEIFIPGVTSAAVFVLAKLNKI